MKPLVTLTTDFGTGSPYVPQMKGVLYSLCREVELVDLTHAIPPQDIMAGALVLDDVTRRFPPGTLHIAVVDPGVGTSRRLIYAQMGPQRYLAPDNGLLTLLARREPPSQVISLEKRQFWLPEVSATFHGRDILAPVAAHLCRGTLPEELGPAVNDMVRLSWAEPGQQGNLIVGQVIHVDSFGNLLTNVTRNHLEPPEDLSSVEIQCAGEVISGLSKTYGSADPGCLVALFDSAGRLEIAVVNGSAADQLKASVGALVTVVPSRLHIPVPPGSDRGRP